jgi:AhpD family alkylhydroperoxidase
MDSHEKSRIEAIILDRKKANQFMRKNSKVFQVFSDLEQKTFSNGSLSKKQKELIALGISLYINCESCMEWHIKQALDDGATKEEIIETIEVSIEMGGGPVTVAGRFAIHVLEYYTANV